MNKDLEEFLIVVVAIMILIGVGLLALLAILLFYGAIFGSIGAGAYWAFKLMTGSGL